MTATLPKADVLMASLLMGMMLAADGAAAVIGLNAPGNWPAFIVMPGTLAMIWTCFTVSCLVTRRFKGPKGPESAQTAARFMGKTLVMVGITLTIFHLGLLALTTGLIGGDGDIILKLFVAALGLNLAFMHNAMPKVMNPARVDVAGSPRLIGWVGFLCGLGIAAVGVFIDPGEMMPFILPLAVLPSIVVAITTFKSRRDRKAG